MSKLPIFTLCAFLSFAICFIGVQAQSYQQSDQDYARESANEGGHRSNESAHKPRQFSSHTSDSILFCLLGIGVCVFSFVILWYNEKRTVNNEKVIVKGQQICREVSSEYVEPSNDHRLVFTKGKITCSPRIFDDEFNVETLLSLRLSRKVEMYLFAERETTRHKRGNSSRKVYEYTTCWSTKYIDHNKFHSLTVRNPGPEAFLFNSKDFYCESANLGAYKLSTIDIQNMPGLKALELANAPTLSSDAQAVLNKCQINNCYAKPVFQNGYLYLKYGPSDVDTIGDLRISYEYLPGGGQVAAVAMQAYGGFAPYNVKQMEGDHLSDENRANLAEQNKNSKDSSSTLFKIACCCCYVARKVLKANQEIYWFYTDKLSKNEIFEDKLSSNSSQSWGFRLLGFFIMFGGNYLTFSPISSILYELNFFANVGSWLVFFFSLTSSLLISLGITSIAWSFYNFQKAIKLLIFGVPFILIFVQAFGHAGLSDEDRARASARPTNSHYATEAGHYTYSEYSYKHRQYYGRNEGESAFWFALGVPIFFISLGMLWFNERRRILSDKVLSKGQQICREISSEFIKAENEHRLVFTRGTILCSPTIIDEDFNIKAFSSLRLNRKVEIYLFEERTEKTRVQHGSRKYGHIEKINYEYKPRWSDKYIDHKNFKDKSIKNPGPEAFLFKSKDFFSESASLGAFKLSEQDLQNIPGLKPFSLSQTPSLSNHAVDLVNSCRINDQTPKIMLYNNFIYIKYGPETTDTIGDLRISYTHLPAGENLSVVAMQYNGGFGPFNVNQLDAEHLSDEKRARLAEKHMKKESFSAFFKIVCCCRYFAKRILKSDHSLYWFYLDKQNAKEIFEDRYKKVSDDCWAFRFTGFFSMLFGSYLCFDRFLDIFGLYQIIINSGYLYYLLIIFLSSLIISVVLINYARKFYESK